MLNGLAAGAGPSPRICGPGGACAESAVAANTVAVSVLRIRSRMVTDYRVRNGSSARSRGSRRKSPSQASAAVVNGTSGG